MIKGRWKKFLSALMIGTMVCSLAGCAKGQGEKRTGYFKNDSYTAAGFNQ